MFVVVRISHKGKFVASMCAGTREECGHMQGLYQGICKDNGDEFRIMTREQKDKIMLSQDPYKTLVK